MPLFFSSPLPSSLDRNGRASSMPGLGFRMAWTDVRQLVNRPIRRRRHTADPSGGGQRATHGEVVSVVPAVVPGPLMLRPRCIGCSLQAAARPRCFGRVWAGGATRRTLSMAAGQTCRQPTPGLAHSDCCCFCSSGLYAPRTPLERVFTSRQSSARSTLRVLGSRSSAA